MRLRNKNGVFPGTVYLDYELIPVGRDMYVEPLKGYISIFSVYDILIINCINRTREEEALSTDTGVCYKMASITMFS